MALSAVAVPPAMNSRAEVDELRNRLAESERQRAAIEANLHATQATLAEKVRGRRRRRPERQHRYHHRHHHIHSFLSLAALQEQELRRLKTFSVVIEEAFKLKEAETGRILTEHKSENEKLRAKLSSSQQRDLIAAGGAVVTGQAVTDAVYSMLAESEDDRCANILLKLKEVRG
jgi:hypothetical protein